MAQVRPHMPGRVLEKYAFEELSSTIILSRLVLKGIYI
jgi:hypothetical protein